MWTKHQKMRVWVRHTTFLFSSVVFFLFFTALRLKTPQGRSYLYARYAPEKVEGKNNKMKQNKNRVQLKKKKMKCKN